MFKYKALSDSPLPPYPRPIALTDIDITNAKSLSCWSYVLGHLQQSPQDLCVCISSGLSQLSNPTDISLEPENSTIIFDFVFFYAWKMIEQLVAAFRKIPISHCLTCNLEMHSFVSSIMLVFWSCCNKEPWTRWYKDRIKASEVCLLLRPLSPCLAGGHLLPVSSWGLFSVCLQPNFFSLYWTWAHSYDSLKCLFKDPVSPK